MLAWTTTPTPYPWPEADAVSRADPRRGAAGSPSVMWHVFKEIFPNYIPIGGMLEDFFP